MASILVDGFDIPLIGIHAVGSQWFCRYSIIVLEAGKYLDGGDLSIEFIGQFAQAIETMNYYDYVSGYTTWSRDGHSKDN